MAYMRNYFLMALSNFEEMFEKKGKSMNGVKETAVILAVSALEVMSAVMTNLVSSGTLP